MGSMIDSIYLRLPRSLQNVALSYYGYSQYRSRYGIALAAPYDSIESHEELLPEQLQDLQSARLSVLIAHAAQYVPYYQRLFARLGVEPAEVNLENFTSVIPVLEKEQVVSDPRDFYSAKHLNRGIVLFTSGTSGSPMPVLCATEARAINYAYYRAKLAQNGCGVRDRSVTLAGRVLFSERESKVYWRKDSYTNTLYMSSYRISESTLPAYVAALQEWQPKYVDSYPSAISEVAKYINVHKIQHNIDLRFVLTSSETLSESQRLEITRAFDCPVIDHYGCTEMAVSAYSRRSGGYYIDPLYSLVECEPSPNSDNRSLVCTGLANVAMPLIRYRIGDSVSDVSRRSDKARFAHQTFELVNGREDDLIVTPDGRHVGRLDPAFKGLAGIRQAQVIQTSVSHLDVLVVLSSDADKTKLALALTNSLRARTSQEMTVTVKWVDRIPLARSGKFRSVVSLLH